MRGEQGVNLGQAEIIAATEKAVLAKSAAFEDGELWIPQTVIHDDSECWAKGDEGELIVKAWWAKKEGIE